MVYYKAEQLMESVGVYSGHSDGYYTFILEDNQVVDFDEINKMLLVKYDLKSDKLKGQKFHVVYKEIIDDLDDEDFVVLKLEELKPM